MPRQRRRDSTSSSSSQKKEFEETLSSSEETTNMNDFDENDNDNEQREDVIDLSGIEPVDVNRNLLVEADEEYARRLQAEEYSMNLFPIDVTDEPHGGLLRLLRARMEVPRRTFPEGLDHEEIHNEGHNIEEQEEEEHDSDDNDSHAEGDSNNDEEDSYMDDEDDAYDSEEEYDFEVYRNMVQRTLLGEAGQPPPAHFMEAFARVYEIVDQMRQHREGFNALGPYIADEDFDSSYEALINLSERIGEVKRRGLTPDAIAQLKRVKWVPLPKNQQTSESISCPICLESYNKDEILILLQCTHRFHSECASRWLLERATCPICRIEISEKSVEE